TPPQARRGGFTMVELLVVMTIIAILVALVAAAVTRVIGKGDEVRVRNDITQLANAVQAFKTDFKVEYIPSRLVLPPATDPESQQYISRLWPRLNPTAYSNAAYWGAPASGAVLEGDQCLVFFLGGYRDPASGACFGFSSDGTNPMAPPTSTSGKRLG